jgi:hypothetical protein
MFDSLDEQIKHEEQSSTKERILRYIAIAAACVLIIGGLIEAAQHLQ